MTLHERIVRDGIHLLRADLVVGEWLNKSPGSVLGTGSERPVPSDGVDAKTHLLQPAQNLNQTLDITQVRIATNQIDKVKAGWNPVFTEFAGEADAPLEVAHLHGTVEKKAPDATVPLAHVTGEMVICHEGLAEKLPRRAGPECREELLGQASLKLRARELYGCPPASCIEELGKLVDPADADSTCQEVCLRSFAAARRRFSGA
mmetsp:Transcript_32024/g.69996  ORF Transcript_32024/g.69996 Transcript_32024/m.69996 type:complete len:204 (-) Transcript_32024:489-1100(-)